MSDTYPGQAVEFSCEFTVAGTATDPTAITLSLMNPAGTVTTYTYSLAEITKDSTGNYSKNVTLDTEGIWRWRWLGTGTVAAAQEGEIEVKRSPFV